MHEKGKLVWEEPPGELAVAPGDDGPRAGFTGMLARGSLPVPIGPRLGQETGTLLAEVRERRLLSLCPGHRPRVWPRAAEELRI